MKKKGKLYYSTKEFKAQAWANKNSVYKEANKDPKKFWAGLAEEVFWFKKWDKIFEHKPPYFKWFKGGKLNITYNIFEKNLEERKNKVAFIWEPEPTEERPRVFTYYELYKEVNKFANGLKKIGVKKGDKVGIYLPMIPEVVIAMLACARIGAIHSVVFSAYSAKALKIRLQDTKAKVLITADGYYRRGGVVPLKKKADQGLKNTDVKNVIVVKRAGNKISWKKGRDNWWDDIIDGQSEHCKPKVMNAEDPIFILYTSGSTGKPKGCVHACGGYTVQSLWTGKLIFDWKDNDIFWSTSDMGWVTGHTYSCYSPLLNGATYLLFEGAPDWPESDRWANIIDKYGVTIFYTAPTAVRMFKKQGEKILKGHNFENLRLLGSVGEPIDESAWKWFFEKIGKKKCPIVDTWWQTETGGILLTSLPGIGPFKPSHTGLPFPGIQADILDENGKSVKKGVEGNLVLRPPFAPSLLRGVYKNPKKYLSTYWSEYGKEIYFTSDSAIKDKNGLIRIVGRVDDVLKVAGHRMSTGELEDAINHIPAINESAVVGIPDEIKGEVPIAFIILKEKKSQKEIEKLIVDKVKKEIGPTALPKAAYIVEDLPKTRSGKIMRRILRNLFVGGEMGDLSTLANPDSVEKLKKTVK